MWFVCNLTCCMQWGSGGQNRHVQSKRHSYMAADKNQAADSTLDTIKRIAETLNTEECSLALEADSALEKAYAQVARNGNTEAPARAEDEVGYHYICFVKSHENDHVYQLDGDRKQPIDLGAVAVDEDVLSDKCLNVIRGMIASEEGNVNFSLMALVPANS
jgi:ubiquitin carboxyl-terminal hydrolase L3